MASRLWLSLKAHGSFEPGGGFVAIANWQNRTVLIRARSSLSNCQVKCHMIDRTERATFDRGTNRGSRRCGPIQIRRILESGSNPRPIKAGVFYYSEDAKSD